MQRSLGPFDGPAVNVKRDRGTVTSLLPEIPLRIERHATVAGMSSVALDWLVCANNRPGEGMFISREPETQVDNGELLLEQRGRIRFANDSTEASETESPWKIARQATALVENGASEHLASSK